MLLRVVYGDYFVMECAQINVLILLNFEWLSSFLLSLLGRDPLIRIRDFLSSHLCVVMQT